MKRIFSKKSGFTLVEIIVAFAIFAIMSTMILSMVDLTVKEKGKNNELSNSIDEQMGYLTYHYIDDTDKYPTAAPGTTVTPDGTFVLNFVDKDGNPASSISMDYAMRSSVDGTANAGDGINYFVGNVDYTDPSTPAGGGSGSGDAIPGLGNSQSSRYDTRIAGSKNIEYINIRSVTRDESYKGSGCRYIIQCSANATVKSGSGASGTVAEDDLPYLQYQLYFYDESNSYTKDVEDGTKTYRYTLYNEAEFTDIGYVDGSSFVSYYDTSPGKLGSKISAKYTLMPLNQRGVRIGVPLGDTSGVGFKDDSNYYVNMYVVFKSDPKLTVQSFGDNASAATVGVAYTAYPIYDDIYATDKKQTGTNLNIYGAFPYSRAEITAKK